LVALSAYGEMQAWQVGMRVSKLSTGTNYLGDVGEQLDLTPLSHNPFILLRN
jgi:hypothetical protein